MHNRFREKKAEGRQFSIKMEVSQVNLDKLTLFIRNNDNYRVQTVGGDKKDEN